MIEKIEKTAIQGCWIIHLKRFQDNRGLFVKTFNSDMFKKHGLLTAFKECYYSISHKNVLRGMHYQKPPMDHVKLVHCLLGRVQDVILDLRVNSPTFKNHISIELSERNRQLIYIPKGAAHGFLSLEERSMLSYSVSTEYSQKHDDGVLWNSCGIQWQINTPILSKRDSEFQTLDECDNPFIY